MKGIIMDILSWIGLVPKQRIFYIGGSDVLPAPLKGQEEQNALELLEQGDESAKQLLIEHNLRLVAHIIKKGYPSRKLFLADCGRNKIR